MEDKKKRGKLNYYIIMKANFKSLNILMFCAFLFTFNFTKPTIINIFLFIIHFGWVSKAQSAGMNLSLASYKANRFPQAWAQLQLQCFISPSMVKKIVHQILPRLMRSSVWCAPMFFTQTFRKKTFHFHSLIFLIIYLFIFRYLFFAL